MADGKSLKEQNSGLIARHDDRTIVAFAWIAAEPLRLLSRNAPHARGASRGGSSTGITALVMIPLPCLA